MAPTLTRSRTPRNCAKICSATFANNINASRKIPPSTTTVDTAARAETGTTAAMAAEAEAGAEAMEVMGTSSRTPRRPPPAPRRSNPRPRGRGREHPRITARSTPNTTAQIRTQPTVDTRTMSPITSTISKPLRSSNSPRALRRPHRRRPAKHHPLPRPDLVLRRPRLLLGLLATVL